MLFIFFFFLSLSLLHLVLFFFLLFCFVFFSSSCPSLKRGRRAAKRPATEIAADRFLHDRVLATNKEGFVSPPLYHLLVCMLVFFDCQKKGNNLTQVGAPATTSFRFAFVQTQGLHMRESR